MYHFPLPDSIIASADVEKLCRHGLGHLISPFAERWPSKPRKSTGQPLSALLERLPRVQWLLQALLRRICMCICICICTPPVAAVLACLALSDGGMVPNVEKEFRY